MVALHWIVVMVRQTWTEGPHILNEVVSCKVTLEIHSKCLYVKLKDLSCLILKYATYQRIIVWSTRMAYLCSQKERIILYWEPPLGCNEST